TVVEVHPADELARAKCPSVSPQDDAVRISRALGTWERQEDRGHKRAAIAERFNAYADLAVTYQQVNSLLYPGERYSLTVRRLAGGNEDRVVQHRHDAVRFPPERRDRLVHEAREVAAGIWCKGVHRGLILRVSA